MSLNAAAIAAAHDGVWLDANRYNDAESRYYALLPAQRPNPVVNRNAGQFNNPGQMNNPGRRANPGQYDNPGHHKNTQASGVSQYSIANEIAHVREKIIHVLKSGDPFEGSVGSILKQLEKCEKEQQSMKKNLEFLTNQMQEMVTKMGAFEDFTKRLDGIVPEASQVLKEVSKNNIQNGSSTAADDDDIDLFGSDEEDDAAATKLREERLQAYANKKSKKPGLVAKSSVVLDVKPWDDETDMKAMEKAVRAIQSDGLVWGASKLVPLAFGIHKLQIIAVVEDEKVSIDWLQETICENEDMVQSVDIAAFNKL